MSDTAVRYTTAAITTAVREHIDQLADDGSVLDQFVALTLLKRDIDACKRKLSEVLADREREFREILVDRGENKAGHNASGKTAYINRRVWARVHREGKDATPEEHEVAAAALRKAELGEFQGVKVNVQGLSGYFSELVKAETARRTDAGDKRPVVVSDLLPEELAPYIDLTEDHVLGLK